MWVPKPRNRLMGLNKVEMVQVKIFLSLLCSLSHLDVFF